MRRRIPETLSQVEQIALVHVIGRRYRTTARNQTLVLVMLGTGIRCAECCGLEWRDINLTTGELRITHGKGGRDRILWLPVAALIALQDLRRWDSGPVVFSTRDGGPVSTRYVRAAVKRYAVRAGIEKNVHPHMLRHTFATDTYRDTHDIRVVQRALGHSDLRDTAIYTHVSDDELRATMQRGA